MNVPWAWLYPLERMQAERRALVWVPVSITLDATSAALDGLIDALKQPER